ncbi:MAG: hypothetical protein IJ632_06360 [Muribaculaceae bacterium]|nr:hypothetical protein [Muribaculaceae bacterium]
MKQFFLFLTLLTFSGASAQSTDITMRHRPLWVVKPAKEQNRFTVVHDKELPANLKHYDRMIFKPHIGSVNLVKSASRTEAGDYQATFALTDAKKVAKMFRGYDNSEFASIIVPHEVLDTHTPLQFSRWKSGETKQELTDEYYLNLIRIRYPEWRIASTQWMATIAGDCDRQFYLVVFEPTPRQALASVVCFSEGRVVSSIDDHADISLDVERTPDGKPMHVWSVCDYGEYSMPEIMAFMDTKKGLEMYVRASGSECYIYRIYRENSGGWDLIDEVAVSDFE